jgi:hypothetical protein
MVVNDPEVSGRFTSYVHHYVEDRAELQGDLLLQDRDAVTIIRIPTMAELGSSKSNDGYRNRIGPDEDNFREVEGSVALLVEENEVAPGADEAPRKLFVFRGARPDDVDGWASKMRHLVNENSLNGAIVNLATAVDGNFPYLQFDEIGLPDRSDLAGVIASINEAALAHFGAADTRMVCAEAVRFI